MAHSINDFVDLTTEQRAVLETFERDDALCQTFYFTGGTLLKALGIVPRISNDLDFFTFPGVDSRSFLSHQQTVHTLLKNLFGEGDVIATDRGLLHRPSGMVIDIIADAIQNIDDFVSYGKLQTAGIKDIAASKAAALCSRDEIKDYIDIAFLTHVNHWSLKDLEEMAERKYGLGTVAEEKLLAELIAKQSQFVISPEIFLRNSEEHSAFVQQQIASLIEHTSL